MISLGLRDSEMDELIRILKSPHWIKVSLQVLDMNHKVIEDISHMMMSGQVSFDSSSDVYRSLELELSDPESKIGLNPDSPEQGAVFMNKMIKVIYSVADAAPVKWYDIPLFVGPVNSLSRNNNTVKIGALGKDSLGLTGVWFGKTFKKNQKITDIMLYILQTVIGESRFSLPSKDKRTDKQVVVGTEVVPLELLRKFAGSVGVELFWDGRGVAQARKSAKGVLHTYNSKNVTSDITFTYDPTTVVNAVKVVGGKPKGKKNKVSAREVAPAGHPLSPTNLGRFIKGEDGSDVLIPRYYTLIIEDGSLKTDKACKKRATEALQKGLNESLNIEFTALPNPLQEEGDMFRINLDDVSMTSRAVQWSIPLTHDGLMSMGVVQKVSFKTRKKGTNKGKHKGRSGQSRNRTRRNRRG